MVQNYVTSFSLKEQGEKKVPKYIRSKVLRVTVYEYKSSFVKVVPSVQSMTALNLTPLHESSGIRRVYTTWPGSVGHNWCYELRSKESLLKR